MFKRVGVVGYGAFGKLLVEELVQVVEEVAVYSRAQPKDLPDKAKYAGIDEVAKSELVFVAVTFDGFDEVLASIAPHLGQDTIVADVCSVKLKPLAKMQEILPNGTKIVATHPLFGPESSHKNQARRAVICVESSTGASAQIAELYQKLGWEVVEMTAEEHDMEMAKIHGLTFFIAQTLLELNLPEPKMPTGFYANLQNLVKIQSKHSDELTQTIEEHNPYSADARAKFLQTARELDHKFKTQ